MQTDEVRVRKATRGDGEHIWRIHTAAVRDTCRSRYTDEEIAAWTSHLNPDAYDGIIRSKTVYVAETEDRVVGFSQLDVVTGKVQAVYVLPAYEGRGIGGRLLETLEDVARECGVKRLHLDSSLNAVTFYERHGYIVRGETVHSMGETLSIACVRMEKDL